MDVVIKLTTVTNPRFHFVLFSVIYYQCFEAWETLKNFSAKKKPRQNCSLELSD